MALLALVTISSFHKQLLSTIHSCPSFIYSASIVISAIMSSNSSPGHLQAPIPVPNRVYGEVPSMYRKEMGLGRIFVQTDIGNVLGIEVDRDDRVQTIKKKLQLALCLPTEQSALTFGDVVLEHDFNEVRNDSPILLTRGLYRTSSTPCLSPSGQKSKDRSKPLEIVGGSHGCPKVKRLVRQCMKALDSGIEPTPAGGGLGGAYCIQNAMGENISIVKPTDEEPFAPNNPNGLVGRTLGQPGLKRSIKVGETGFREVAAYLLDHRHFAQKLACGHVYHPECLEKTTSEANQQDPSCPLCIASEEMLSKRLPSPVERIIRSKGGGLRAYRSQSQSSTRNKMSRIGVANDDIVDPQFFSGEILLSCKDRLSIDNVVKLSSSKIEKDSFNKSLFRRHFSLRGKSKEEHTTVEAGCKLSGTSRHSGESSTGNDFSLQHAKHSGSFRYFRKWVHE